jgi:hypothetical protein
MKTFKTSKKFYKKWLFKLSLTVSGASSFNCYDLDRINELCQVPEVNNHHDWRQSNVIKNRRQFERVVACLKTKDTKLWAKRVEGHFLDIYTNDKELYDLMSLDLADLIAQRYEPDELHIDLLDNANTIVCDALPHKRYNYRVYLQPHKLEGNREAKQKALDWMIAQSPKITCTPAVQAWFMKTDWNWDRRYVLVEDEGTLLMLKLRCDNVVGTVYNYVVVDK